MNDARRRGIGYGIAGILAAGLFYGGFVYDPPADVPTLLGAIDVQVRLAYGIPAEDDEGRELTARTKMLDDVRVMLDQVEDQEPRLAVTGEYRGFVAYLSGDHLEAAAHYREARGLRDCDPDLRDSLVFNEVRMLREVGRHARGLQVLREERPGLQEKYREEAEVFEAEILADLGEDEQAGDKAASLAVAAATSPMARVRAGVVLERTGRADQAEAAWERARSETTLAEYHLARLKMARGEVDSAFELLEHAAAEAPAFVRRRLREDRDEWAAVEGDARFVELAGIPAAPR